MHAMNIASMHHRFAHLSNISRRWTRGSSSSEANHNTDDGMTEAYYRTDNQCIWCKYKWRCPIQRFSPSFNTKIPKGYTSPDDHLKLHSALETNDCRMVEHLVNLGIMPCSTDGVESCFALITKYWSSEFLKLMLENEPSAVHSRGPKGQTLLMYTRDLCTMKVLLEFEPEKHVNARNAKGKTVLDYLWKNVKDLRAPMLIAALLDAGATIPATDSRGRSALMHAAMRLFNADYDHVVLALLNRGVDVNARDKAGHNAMFYAVKSLRQHSRIEKPDRVAKVCLELLQRGCEIQGLDITFKVKPRKIYKDIFYEYKFDERCVSINVISLILSTSDTVDFVLALPESVLKTVNQKSTKCLLTSYLMGYRELAPRVNMDQLDAIVTKFLASDVDLSQSVLRFDNKPMQMWSEKLQVPDSLCLAMLVLLKVCERGSYLRSQKNLHIAIKVLVSLLQFWCQPPLALLLFPFRPDYVENGRFTMFMINLLARVGGPLLPGSPVFHAVRNNLLYDIHINDYAVQYLDRFDKLHANAPSLRDLSRHVVRASLGKSNKMRKLRTKTQGEIREIPLEVQDFLKFKEQPYFDKDDLPIEFHDIFAKDK